VTCEYNPNPCDTCDLPRCPIDDEEIQRDYERLRTELKINRQRIVDAEKNIDEILSKLQAMEDEYKNEVLTLDLGWKSAL